MNIVLWIVAGVLAAMFLLAGVMKIAVPKEKLLSIMKWARTWPEPRLKALGAAEVLGAIGLILPRALEHRPGAHAGRGGRLRDRHGRRDHRPLPHEGLRGHRDARRAA